VAVQAGRIPASFILHPMDPHFPDDGNTSIAVAKVDCGPAGRDSVRVLKWEFTPHGTEPTQSIGWSLLPVLYYCLKLPCANPLHLSCWSSRIVCRPIYVNLYVHSLRAASSGPWVGSNEG
jgi:hypothetical protein